MVSNLKIRVPVTVAYEQSYNLKGRFIEITAASYLIVSHPLVALPWLGGGKRARMGQVGANSGGGSVPYGSDDDVLWTKQV